MDIEVRHGSTNITSRVIQYIREHQICTGIGRLQITIEGTYSAAIDPHDAINIYENGDFKVKYYVSDVDRSAPDGTIRLECQDRSKYLVDYFISESYTIDYPSYTRYWIEKFFDEAGINYEFTTDSQGNLLSNYTQLGLAPAYDQIMMLCQMSGWYFYFDGNGKAIIGSLTTDLSSGGEVGKTDILEIKRVSDDKMLRNRAVVWGQYDPIRREYAYADISKHTPWNYDHDDLRTMVVSNNNIPNKSSAYSIANILLKEFAKITVEKHLVVHGARDFNLGDTLRVDSHVWRGKGLITTFGVTMDRNGLVTNVILDERCPRLFGFFDFGDYVYVGTFGDGVWRKHIKFDPNWYNFSTGLLDLSVTDLHINNGVFGSVTQSGGMFIANNEAGPWFNVAVESLESSVETTTTSGIVEYAPFSGIMGRATIVDKLTNNVKFGVDNYSGMNTGDYFLTYSEMFSTSSGIITASGVTESGMDRGWILEYDPFTGELVGGLGSGIYPISVSGNYDIRVLDLENDGRNDYVSVRLGGGQTLDGNDGIYNLGLHTNQPYLSHDDGSFVVFPTSSGIIQSSQTTIGIADINALIVVNNGADDSKIIVYEDYIAGITNSHVMRERRVTREWDDDLQEWDTTTVTTTSPVIGTDVKVKAIHQDAGVSRTYHFYYRTTVSSVTTWWRRSWDAIANTLGTATSVTTVDMTKATRGITNSGTSDQDIYEVVIDDTIYSLHTAWYNGNVFATEPAVMLFVLNKIHMGTGVITETVLFSYETERHEDLPSTNIYYFLGRIANSPTGPVVGMWTEGNRIKIAGWVGLDFIGSDGGTARAVRSDHVLLGDDSGVSMGQFYFDQGTGDFSTTDTFMPRSGVEGSVFTGMDDRRQKNTDRFNGFMVVQGSSASTAGYVGMVYNGTTVKMLTTAVANTFQHRFDRIYPIFTEDSLYIAKDNSGNFWLCSSDSLEPISQITAPAGYELTVPISSTSSFGLANYYWITRSTTDFDYYLVPASSSGFSIGQILKLDGVSSAGARPSIIAGEFIIEDAANASIGGPAKSDCSLIYAILDNLPSAASFLILQRENSDFNIIQQAAKPLRIDISNASPIVSVQDYENTFHSFFVYGQDVTEVFSLSGVVTSEVRDYRYTLLETQSGIIVASGSPVTSQILYVNGSGIYSADSATYSGGFMLMDTIPSGLAERIETTNYAYPGQFIFVTTSGDFPMFYQRDNDSLFFDSYSGLPDSRATIIRCDDRM